MGFENNANFELYKFKMKMGLIRYKEIQPNQQDYHLIHQKLPQNHYDYNKSGTSFQNCPRTFEKSNRKEEDRKRATYRWIMENKEGTEEEARKFTARL